MKWFKFYSLIILLLSTLISFGQDRVNRQKISFDTTSQLLTKATGWNYNSIIGEWVDYKNVICGDKDYKGKYASLQGGPYMMSNFDSFNSIQFKTITFNNKKYYVLVINMWSGAYEYPSLRMDWYEFKETIGYIFNEEEYQKLLKIDSLVVLNTKISVHIGSKYQKYDDIEFLDLIQTALLSDNKYSDSLVWPILKTKEGYIRFQLPKRVPYYGEPYNFKDSYFETDYNNFKRILL